jgi:hypothetical protein
MEEALPAFELELFEQVDAMPGTTLLRVVGRPRAEIPAHQTATLTIEAGRRSYRLTALPGPSQMVGLLALGFLAPSALLDGAVGFKLSLGESISMSLPEPAQGRKLSVPQDAQANDMTARLGEARNMVITALEEALAERAALLAEREEEQQQLRERLRHAERGWQQAEALNAELLQRIERLEARLNRAAKARPRNTKSRRNTEPKQETKPLPAAEEPAEQRPEISPVGASPASRQHTPEFDRWVASVLSELNAAEGSNSHDKAIDKVLEELAALEDERSEGASPTGPEAA